MKQERPSRVRWSAWLGIVKATIKISAIKVHVEVDCDDEELGAKAQRIIDSNQESIEAAMANGVMRHLERLLPGVKATCIGAWNEDEDSDS